jgi:hypothetical protein
VFPQFVAEGWNQGAVEEGEGHGPRKEFFALAGRDMCGRGGEGGGEGGGGGGGKGGSEGATTVHAAAGTGTYDQRKFNAADGNDDSNADADADVNAAAVVAVAAATKEKGEDGDGGEESRCPPLFVYNREAGAEWFNQTLTRTKRLESAYRYAGWLMGQVGNHPPLVALGILNPTIYVLNK